MMKKNEKSQSISLPEYARLPHPNPVLEVPEEARALAREWASAYFEALSRQMPCDCAPGGVDLIAAFCEIRAIMKACPATIDVDAQAGYVLGVEVGRRMAGGAR